MRIINSGRGIHQREIPGVERLGQLPDDWIAYTNLDLALPGKGVREIDVVIVADDRILLIDLKDWIGPISCNEGNWFNGTRNCGRSPVQKVAENVRALLPLLKRFLADREKREQTRERLFVPRVDGAVVLTRASDRSGVAPTEIERVFSVEPFIRMLKNQTERNKQLGAAHANHDDLTSPEWKARLSRFFNMSTGIFQPGARRYGGFVSRSEFPSFVHRSAIYSEFDADEEGIATSHGLLRIWDFARADTRFQSEEGRRTIAGREKNVIAWLSDRSARCEGSILRQKIEEPDRGVGYWEVFDRRRRMRRLSEFVTSVRKNITPAEKLELARQIVSAVKAMHELRAAHLDIGSHSIWIEPPTTVRLSHLMAASIPEVETLGVARFQFLSTVQAPEEVLGCSSDPLRKDVFLLGCAIHELVFGELPAGDPPEWTELVDPDGECSALYPWFQRSLEIDALDRFANASEMLDALNSALGASSLNQNRLVIESLERFRGLKSQLQVFKKFPEQELLKEDERIAIWRTETDGHPQVVKLWKGAALGDVTKEASRILAFLERAAALIESPAAGTVGLREAYWTGDAIVLVQEFVAGRTLAEALAARSAIVHRDNAINCLVGLIEIINALHERSLAHGDIKPSNIMIVESDAGRPPTMVLLDVLDFSSQVDGERLTGAYAPNAGGRFERDRYALTRIAEELLEVAEVPLELKVEVAQAIELCRTTAPANGTLLPVLEALQRARKASAESITTFTIAAPGVEAGPLLADEGCYWVSRFGSRLFIRGATEQLEIALDSSDVAISLKRTRLKQSAIQRIHRDETTSIACAIVVRSDRSDLSAVAAILALPALAKVHSHTAPRQLVDGSEETEPESEAAEALDDALGERMQDASVAPSFDVHRLWQRMMELEADLTTEAVATGDSAFRPSTRRHVVPIQMVAGELDFDRDDTVVVERLEGKGRWTKIGYLDSHQSLADFISIDSWIDVGRGSVVNDGARLRFQSRYENTSRERREAATVRILRGAAAAPGLFDVFRPTKAIAPRGTSHLINAPVVQNRYGLNLSQVEALKKAVEARPLGLVQGPPGTGKTKFIGALVHYALTNGLAKNVLLASQSHEAVNNAAEAVLNLFGQDRDSLSLIRVGHESSISDVLRPFHVARVETAFKDRFQATLKQRLRVIAASLELGDEVVDRVLFLEEVVRPVIVRLVEIANDREANVARFDSLMETLHQLLLTCAIPVTAMDGDPLELEGRVLTQFYAGVSVGDTRKVDKLRQVVQLSRDILGSVSTWQRSFETFLAGTRHVVAGTCVGLGRTALGLTQTAFDLVVVDEAARCTPSELAVPIQAGKWVVLVGDHAQLEPLHPAEVVEQISEEMQVPLREVARSDFERVFESSYGVAAGATLVKQYRMLPPIGRMISSAFYERRLQHGRTIPIVDIHAMPAELHKPVLWISTDSLGTEAYQVRALERRGSLVNPVEVDCILTLLRVWSGDERFVEWLSSQKIQTHAIGVICAYSAQRDMLWRKLQSENVTEVLRKAVKIDTIDSYQGKQNPIVIVSLVRNNAEGMMTATGNLIRPGFLARSNRVNVAVSRAMDRLIVVGAMDRWKRGSPVDLIAQAFYEEMRCDEASVLEAKELLKRPRRTGRRKRNTGSSDSDESPEEAGSDD